MVNIYKIVAEIHKYTRLADFHKFRDIVLYKGKTEIALLGTTVKAQQFR
jgi:hypothetical protein